MSRRRLPWLALCDTPVQSFISAGALLVATKEGVRDGRSAPPIKTREASAAGEDHPEMRHVFPHDVIRRDIHQLLRIA